MTLAPRSRRLYVSFWNHTFEVLDPMSLEMVCAYDVDACYAVLAVDAAERWAVAATGPFLDLIDLEDGRRAARRTARAEVTALIVPEPGVAIVGLASGQLMRATWSP